MPTLADFHTLVVSELNKGSSLTSMVPDKVRQAAKFLETNYDFQYMGTYQSFTIAYGATAIDLPDRYKSMRWIYLDYTGVSNQAESEFRFLNKVDGSQITRLTSATDVISRPTGWWQDGNETIRLDATITESAGVPGKLYYNRFSAWPSSPYSSTPEILDNHELLLLYQTMLQFAPYTRNSEQQLQYKALRDECLAVAIGSDKNAQYEGASMAMIYQ